MKIAFDILDTEVDYIAILFGYDGSTDKEEFVLEQFKKFGRDCIVSYASRMAYLDQETSTKTIVESAKASISF